MRIEKGHVAGNELKARPRPRDLGLGRMMSTKKDFIGRVLAGRPALVDAERGRASSASSRSTASAAPARRRALPDTRRRRHG